MSDVEPYMTDTETGSSEEASGSEGEVASWISWFCSLKGNEFYCEVEEDYIQDDFNLSGLSAQVPYYDYALDLILDTDSPNDESLSDDQHEIVESAAEMLYGLIHVRWILTSRGLTAMKDKYKRGDFGACPRHLCCGQPVIPVGATDVPRQNTVKVFCPLCEDVYCPRSKYHDNIDGAHFGTTFPHLLLMTFPNLRPDVMAEPYVPKAFGFKIHHSALNRPAPIEGPKETRSMAMARKKEQKDSKLEEEYPNGSAMQE